MAKVKPSIIEESGAIGDRVFPLQELRGIGLIQRQGMVFSTADADYAVTAQRLRCVRKYQTLFEFLKAKHA